MGFTYSTEAIRLWRLDDFMKVIDKYDRFLNKEVKG